MSKLVNVLNALFALFARPLLCLESGLVVMALSFYLRYRGVQGYSDLIAGNLAIGNSIKNGEYVSLALFLLVTVSVYVVLTRYQRKLMAQRGDSLVEALVALCCIAQIPAMVWISSLIWSTGMLSLNYLLFSFLCSWIVILKGIVVSRTVAHFPTMEAAFGILGSHLLAVFMSFFSGLGILLSIFRLVGGVKPLATADLFYISGAYALIGLAISLYLLSIGSEKRSRRSWILYLYSHLGLPLLFIDFIPPDGPTGFSHVMIQKALIIATWIMVIGGYFDLLRRTRKGQTAKSMPAWSPLALLVILLYAKIPTITSTGWFPTDFYHHGEYLLPWKLWIEFGQIPYWDHLPARGLDNYLGSICASLFLTPDAPGWFLAQKLAAGFYLALMFFLLRSAIGTVPTFAMLSFYPASHSGHIAISGVCAAVLAWLIAMRNRIHTAVWPALWFLAGTGLVLYAPAEGGLTVLATLPVGLFWTYLALREFPLRTVKVLTLTLFCTACLLFITGADKMLYGAVRYAVEQAPINIIANGIPWHKWFWGEHETNTILWHILRTSWIIVGVAAGCIAYHDWEQSRNIKQGTVAVLGLVIFLLALLYIPRAACRIGPSWTRMGMFSLCFLLLLFPLMFFWKPKIRYILAGTLMLTLAYGAAPKALIPWSHLMADKRASLSLPALVRKPVVSMKVNQKLIDATDYGLPSLGHTQMPAAQLDELSRVKAILDRFTQPGETYLDLTSKNANYYIYEYPPPIESAAIFNLYSWGQQKRALDRLTESPPPIVYAWPAVLFGKWKSSIRSHMVTKYVIENYMPITDGKHIFYVDPIRFNRTDTNGLGLIKTDRHELDNKTFWMPDLYSLPLAWGGALESLQRNSVEYSASIDFTHPIRMNDMQHKGKGVYRAEGKEPFVVFKIVPGNFSMDNLGLLLLELESNVKPTSANRIKVLWKKDIHRLGEGHSVRFRWDNGKMLVPLDAIPSWLLGGPATEIRIDFPSRRGAVFSITNLQFWKRRKMI